MLYQPVVFLNSQYDKKNKKIVVKNLQITNFTYIVNHCETNGACYMKSN